MWWTWFRLHSNDRPWAINSPMYTKSNHSLDFFIIPSKKMSNIQPTHLLIQHMGLISHHLMHHVYYVVGQGLCYQSLEKKSVTIFQFGIPKWCHFANSSGLGSMSLCHHNISKNPSYDLTLLSLPTIVRSSLIICTLWARAWPYVWGYDSWKYN